MTSVIVDTGPLVALLNQSEQSHQWAVQQAGQLRWPFVSCEAVITEACFLLASRPNGVERVLEYVERGDIVLDLSLAEQAARVRSLIAKYADLPMSLADACLVRMAEMRPRARVFTLDSHFRIYRVHGRKKVPVIMPD